jgi:hypothetical protein
MSGRPPVPLMREDESRSQNHSHPRSARLPSGSPCAGCVSVSRMVGAPCCRWSDDPIHADDMPASVRGRAPPVAWSSLRRPTAERRCRPLGAEPSSPPQAFVAPARHQLRRPVMGQLVALSLHLMEQLHQVQQARSFLSAQVLRHRRALTPGIDHRRVVQEAAYLCKLLVVQWSLSASAYGVTTQTPLGPGRRTSSSTW